MAMALAVMLTGCAKKEFSEQDAIAAQTQLLNLQYQHEIALETLKQQGATALQQLMNQAALDQLKLNDSLTQAKSINAQKQDYSIGVVDVVSNAPIAGATVMVSSQGKVLSATTDAQGVATFTSLYLFPTSAFIISKTGYAATEILQQNIGAGPVRLWNTSDLSNQISGTLSIDTNLTNTTAEKVGANILVTASTAIPGNTSGTYTVSFPTYTKADGTYSISVPVAPNAYTLSFAQIVANQKLFVNATSDDPATGFPSVAPHIANLKTYFNVGNYSASVPSVTTSYYYRFAADKGGNVLIVPSYTSSYYYYNSNYAYVSAVNGKYQVEKLFVNGYYTNNGNYVDYSTYNFDPNSQINVDMVDVAGNIIQTAPLLMAKTDAGGRLVSYTSTEGGSGYVHLRRDASGNLVPNAKGVILRAGGYDYYNNAYPLNFTNNLNTVAGFNYNGTSVNMSNRGDKVIVNFNYGSGASRDKQVY